MSINPFDNDDGSSFVSLDEEHTACGRPRRFPASKRAGLRVWTTSNRTGPIYGRRVYGRGWQRTPANWVNPGFHGGIGWNLMTGHFR